MWVRDPKVAAPSSRSPPFLLLLFLSLAVSSTTFRPTFHARFAGSFCTFVVRPDACVPVQSRAATPSLSFSSMAVPRLLRQNVFQYFFFPKITFLHEYFVYPIREFFLEIPFPIFFRKYSFLPRNKQWGTSRIFRGAIFLEEKKFWRTFSPNGIKGFDRRRG